MIIITEEVVKFRCLLVLTLECYVLKLDPKLRNIIVLDVDAMCNGVKGHLTFVHRSTRCTGSQGPSGLGYGPPSATVWLLGAGKVIVVGLLPTTVAWDVRSYASYRISGRWCIRCCVTIYVMYRQYKSGCNPIPGSPFASPVAGDISTPLPIEPS